MAFVHDGVELIGRIVVPETQGPHPAVMVMHNGLGLNERMLDTARLLAQRRYAAVATDMYTVYVTGRSDNVGDAPQYQEFPPRLQAP